MKNKTKSIQCECIFVFFLIILYICIRSLHFSEVFNFSAEQGAFATKALQLFRDKKIELIGPPVSYRYNGRYFFQGSLTYYVMMVLLFLGRWNPLISTYLMVILGALMLIPLYIGTRLLTDKKTASVVSFLFTALPFYIDYSRFFWNPTLQFLFTPLVILWMGLYLKYKNPVYLFLVSFTSGVLLLFHYQYVLIIIGLIGYYHFNPDLHRDDIKRYILFIAGFLLGFSPMILFELRNQFYNTQTLFLFFKHADTVFFHKGSGFIEFFTSYYMLSPLLFLFVFLGRYLKKIPGRVLMGLGVCGILGVFGLYTKTPSHAFGMAKDWNYTYEEKAYQIIKSQNITNFNIANIGYDTVASVQKYFLVRDKLQGNWDDYYHNKYLFLITNHQDYMKNPAYEIRYFSPNVVVNKWRLNKTYDLYLLKRTSLQ